ncbi:MAG: sulfatase [Kiritimatiellae bacterium]|nr:sulfatase [Kiritimatiellia bacterium]
MWGSLVIAVMTATAAARAPNIVLFLVDDMGWMDCGAYGSQYYRTPNIDRLAREGMRFTDAYATPLCSPTRASILPGQYSARHRVTGATGHLRPPPAGTSPYTASAPASRPLIYPTSATYLDTNVVTLARVLRSAGYRTAHFGKWHLGLMPAYWPERHGFEVAWHCAPDAAPPSYFSPYGVVPEPRAGARYIGTITDGPPGEHITDRTVTEALRFIEAHRAEPFYVNLWLYSVHGPFQHKEEYTAEFARKRDPTGRQGNPVMASMLKTVDENLGRLVRGLDDLGLSSNTLFVFFSDNGGNVHSWTPQDPKTRTMMRPGHPLHLTFQSYRRWAGEQPPTNNDPLREGKGRLYEGGIRVPLIVRWPGRVPAGTTNATVVGCVDLFPTILEAVGCPSPPAHTVDGVSFLPALLEGRELRREPYFVWFPHLIPGVVVRAGDWKLIRRFEPHPEYPETRELYHLRTDIGESKNLAGEMRAKVRELDALIDDFVRRTGALMPRPNPSYRPGTTGDVIGGSTEGLVARQCAAVVTSGVLRVTATGPEPFLGTGRVQINGPLRMALTIRAPAGGTAHVRWILTEQSRFPAQGQCVSFDVPAGEDWREVQVDVPVEGRARILRLYLPADREPIELRRIEFRGAAGARRAWEFQ